MATITNHRQSSPESLNIGAAWAPSGVSGVQAPLPVLGATILASHPGFGYPFPHGLLIGLLHPLLRERGIAFTRLNRRMAPQVLDHHDLRPGFQQVGRK